MNIGGKVYSVVLCEAQIDVDPEQAKALGGIINNWKREIRVHCGGTKEDTFEYLLHEIIHGVEAVLMLEDLDHKHVHLLSVGLADFLVRNKWVDIEKILEKYSGKEEARVPGSDAGGSEAGGSDEKSETLAESMRRLDESVRVQMRKRVLGHPPLQRGVRVLRD
jgi:hypothetical protein